MEPFPRELFFSLRASVSAPPPEGDSLLREIKSQAHEGYAEFLKRSGYLEVVVEDERLSYVLTKNGIAFLDRVKMLFEDKRASTDYVSYGYSS